MTEYNEPTTIAAEPGYSVAEFNAASDLFPAKFFYTPIIAWLIPSSQHNKFSPVCRAEVYPITIDGWSPKKYDFPLFIKHPDGSFTLVDADEPLRYEDERAAIKGAISEIKLMEEARVNAKAFAVQMKIKTGKPVDVYDVREAARWVMRESIALGHKAEGRDTVASILAEHNAQCISELDPASYNAVTVKLFEKVPA